jgi:prepilin-type N-terminal cleavage/methylation domain-containing protein
MSTVLLRFHRRQRGVSLIELLVALAVFALFVLIIDGVFRSARTNSSKTQIAADVQQNARVAVDRIIRELRETNKNQMLLGSGQIVFKSARCAASPATVCTPPGNPDSSIFCLYTKTNSGLGYDPRCFSSFTPSIPAPPYSGAPPAPCIISSPAQPTDIPCTSYTPLWQRYVGYYLSGPDTNGLYALQRVYGALAQPNQTLSLLVLTGGDTIATMIQSFVVSGSNVISVTLQAQGTQVVQGQAIPAQQIQLPGQAMTRN